MKKIGNIYAQIAAVCLAIYCVFGISNVAIDVYYDVYYHEIRISLNYLLLYVPSTITWIGMIGLVVAILMNSRIGSTIADGVLVLPSIYYIIDYFSLYNLLELAAYGSLLVIAIVSLIEGTIVKKIWFIPAALMLLNELIKWVSYKWYSGMVLVLNIVLCIGLILVGMWLRSFGTSAQAAPSKNKTSQFLVLVGAGLVLLSVLIACYTFYDCEGAASGVSYYYFSDFFWAAAFTYVYGYMFVLGLAALLAGFIMSYISDRVPDGAQNGRQWPTEAPVFTPRPHSRSCPVCGASCTDAGATFCGVCGAKMDSKIICRSCGTELKPNMRFCTGCGAPVQAGPAEPTRKFDRKIEREDNF